jgi:Protein of unknown function (DUF6044)
MHKGYAAPASRYRLALFALVAAALFTVESWGLGPFSWMYGYGESLEHVAVHLALAHEGRNFSLWAPFLLGGVDRLGFWGPNDPFNLQILLFSLLPAWLANGLHRFLQYFVAVYFTALVAQTRFGLSPYWSGFAGLLHACFGYFTAVEMLVHPGVPLMIWLLDSLIRTERSYWLALLAGLVFSTLTAFAQSDPYLLAFAAGWFVIVKSSSGTFGLPYVLLFALGLVGGDCPQIFSVLGNAQLSQRTAFTPEVISFSIDGLFYRQLHFDYFNQDPLLRKFMMTFPGVALLLGVPLALAARRWRPELSSTAAAYLRVFALYALLSQRWLMVLAQTELASFLPWTASIGMSRFYAVPAAFMIATELTLMAFIAWRGFLPWITVRRALVAIACVFVAGMIVRPKVFHFYPHGVYGWGGKNYQVAALEEIRRSEREPFRVASVLPLQPAYAYGQGLETADGWSNLFPLAYREVWLRVLAPLFERLPANRQIFDPPNGRPQDHYIFLGADLIVPGVGKLPGEDPKQAIKDGFDISQRFNLDLLRMLNVRYLLSEYPLKAAGLELAHAPSAAPRWPQSRDWATGYASAPFPPPDPEGPHSRFARSLIDYRNALARMSRGKDLYIYRLTGSMPRFRFVEKVVAVHAKKEALDTLASLDGAGHRTTAVVQETDAMGLPSGHAFTTGAVRVLRYAPDEILLELDNAGAGFLVIANTYNPYWRAEIDGQPRTLIRTNHAQLGVPTRPGERRVRLVYVPPYAPGEMLRRLQSAVTPGSAAPER